MDAEAERDGLVIFDDVRPVAPKPVGVGAVASLVTLVALGVVFAIALIVVLMYVVVPWVGMFLNVGPTR